MDGSEKQLLDDFLEQARIKSKEFYIKAAQNAIEQAYECSREAILAARKTAERLKAYAENGSAQERGSVDEAAEAASLAVSVELKDRD